MSNLEKLVELIKRWRPDLVPMPRVAGGLVPRNGEVYKPRWWVPLGRPKPTRLDHETEEQRSD